MSSIQLRNPRNNDIIADSLGAVLHMLALQRIPSKCMCSVPKPHTEQSASADGCHKDSNTEASVAINSKLANDDLEELWNVSMEDASIKDAVSARFVVIAKLSADFRVPCIHSTLCFAFTLRLLLDKRATEALDVCEYWLVELENIRKINPECLVWYRIGHSACRALAYAILSQGIKARDSLISAEKELEMCDRPGLRGYISFIGLLAAGALCEKRQNADADSDTEYLIWTNPDRWKQCAVAHISHTLSRQKLLDVSVQMAQSRSDSRDSDSKSCDKRYKRRSSNIFEHQEVMERASFLNDSDLMLLIMNQHASLTAGLKRMNQLTSEEPIENECVFSEIFKHMHSWKSALDQVIVSATGKTQQL